MHSEIQNLVLRGERKLVDTAISYSSSAPVVVVYSARYRLGRIAEGNQAQRLLLPRGFFSAT